MKLGNEAEPMLASNAEIIYRVDKAATMELLLEMVNI